MYDFDKIIDRKNTNSLKYDFSKERKKPEGVLPFWVADMDFRIVDEVVRDLKQTAEHGIFGYSDSKEEYYSVVRQWYRERFDWETKDYHILKTPGIVFFLALAIKALTKEGDSVLIQNPVYYPFSEVIKSNNRKLVNNSLILKNNHYEIDFIDFENKIITNNVKLFILCSPHNPVGRVWKTDELKRLGEICLKHDVYIVSDEIHSDFDLYSKHHVLANLSEDLSKITITCTSPSKTFNLAGLQVSNIFIKDKSLFKLLLLEYEKTGYSQLNSFALVGCLSAYKNGRTWLNELREYIKGNIDYLKEYIKNNIPSIKVIDSEGTYLVWLDLRQLNLGVKEQEDLIVNKANLWLDSGYIFGKEGIGFERINVACSRQFLTKGLDSLKEAINNISK